MAKEEAKPGSKSDHPSVPADGEKRSAAVDGSLAASRETRIANDETREAGDTLPAAGDDPTDSAFPWGAGPEWQQFYRAIRQAMLDIRSE